VLDQTEQLGRQRRLRHRHGACSPNPGRHFHHVIVGESGEDAPIAYVHHLDLVAVCRERREQLSRGRDRAGECSAAGPQVLRLR
jgi:hypothetical protein